MEFIYSTMNWIKRVFPVPPGPVTNRFCPLVNFAKAYFCSVERLENPFWREGVEKHEKVGSKIALMILKCLEFEFER
jgi:hypothetical protein